MGTQSPFVGNLNSGFENPRPWQRTPNFDLDTYGKFPYREGLAAPPPPPPHCPPPGPLPYEYGGNAYVSEGDRNFKRPRVDGSGLKTEFNPNNASLSSDNDRRLKLIRDHGGVGSVSDSNTVSNSGTNRYAEESKDSRPVNESQHSHVNAPYYDHTNQLPQPYGIQQHSVRQSLGRQLPGAAQQGTTPNTNENGCYFSTPASGRFVSENAGHLRASRSFSGQPPLPTTPPPPLPMDPPSKSSSSLFPVSFGSSPMRSSAYPPYPEAHSPAQPYFHSSGKSYLAKMLRDLEVENGGDAPRVHSMDDYFMTEVEKVEEIDVSKSSSSARGKKGVVKKVMEYCYEPEMEEAYRSSMLKAFKKTLDEGVFTFIIVDDRNLRIADFAQFWAIAKSSGYEVYILEAPYKDPAGCAARNVHGFTQDDIQKMAGQWEEAPSLYLQLDAKLLFYGDDLKESDIQEVDMDTEDADNDGSPVLDERKPEKIIAPPAEDDAQNGPSNGGKSFDAEEDHPTEEVKELGRSKWSEILADDDTEKADGAKGKFNALSGLIQAYRKEAKSVCWSDQVGYTGFSIAAAKKANVLSLVIGPGSGYNLKSNPLPEEENSTTHSSGESKKQKAFQEQLRAERESFKAVFDRRRQRIGGLGLGEE
ncbi:YLP motif-containing protein 1 isoform X3 [Pyrus x bretschneideri]|uniref:YLP motif-containing protein 1 isoform X3 n=1 Tax=Pyrus x bretschneideri TaxID=225117 RepID=UPI00203054C0|nr:YLP motif-containing protein 1 isoform X3 [Pyrus x bretschneideri]